MRSKMWVDIKTMKMKTSKQSTVKFRVNPLHATAWVMLRCQDIVASKRATFVLLRFVRFVLLLSFISRHFYLSPNCPASYVFDCVSSNLFICFRKFSSFFKLKFLTTAFSALKEIIFESLKQSREK